ncbi:DsbA family oxidoreductase [Ornithinibacillus halotolerans]|uniref:DSBA oxidoreductase n=1 Tax=Ornithinibacillus halotolerans TaxID=1274357 RepID=A0A916S443_9BACI|nr:DsbA family oxidoreductase [Ornithinibacillus halotolerans]GGA82546.1 DSBA oxidoreductase [Ornithinibacillus halotolerans]
MKITIWSDFVCPFCYIGESHLSQALESFEHADEVKIEYKSFLLMPDAEYVPGKSYAETFSDMKGIPIEQAKLMLNQVVDMGKNSGLDINYDIAKLSSTTDAHRVFQYAKKLGKGNEFFSRFYTAHFTEGEILSEKETIIRLAEDVGLDVDEVQRVLDSSEYNESVTQELQEARAVGVQGVPFFVFIDKYAVSGAQPVETFIQVLNKVWEEQKS